MVTANDNIYSNQPRNRGANNIPALMRRINALEDNAQQILETAFNRYDKDMTKTSLGTPDAGVSVPALTALDAETVLTCPDYITDMRTAIEALAPFYVNADTSNAFNWNDSDADNLYYVAMGDRTDYGATGGADYDWTRTHATMDGPNAPSYDMDIGEVYETIVRLEGSALVAGGYNFGDVIRFAATQSAVPSGIGGDANTIWHCERSGDKIYELSTVDFSSVRNAAAPDTLPEGIGGDANTIWHCDTNSDKNYELSTVDLSSSRSANAPNLNPFGIGGDANTIWHCNSAQTKVYELSTVDLSSIRSAASPENLPYGIGGDANTIWLCARTNHKIYELSTVDFSSVRNAGLPGTQAQGIGGDANTIWHCDVGTDKIYELST